MNYPNISKPFLNTVSNSVNTGEPVLESEMFKQFNDSNTDTVDSELFEKLVQERVAQEQDDPKKKYLDGNMFVPMRLAQEIMKGISVVTLSDTKEIYVYENGVYKEGEDLIRQIAQEKLKDKANKHRLNEVVNYIKNERDVIRNREDFNRETRIINLKNGLYDLNSSEFKSHTPEFLSTTQVPVNYDPNATCPRVNKFLSEVVSKEDAKILLEFAGYALIPENKMKKSVMLLGTGNNGKTLYLNFQREFIGEKNISSENLQDLSNNRYSSANLYGKLLNIASDMGNSKLRQTETLKALTGRDKIRAERKFQNAFEFENTARLIFATNKPPKPNDENDNAFFKRWIFITFPNKFEGENADEDLLDKLTTDNELSGFLNKALEALKELLSKGEFSGSKTVEELKRTYLRNSSSVSAFIDECVERDTDGKVYKDEMYEKYVNWCPDSVTPDCIKTFIVNLKKCGILYKKDTIPNEKGKREYHWVNVSLIEN